VRRVQSYLRRGFTYTETPPARRVPLDAFLFGDKVGYCQQFSGAMALLLRMGGVPARVATGLQPGHARHRPARVRRARLRRALVGRGVLPRLRLDDVRPDPRDRTAARAGRGPRRAG
jgi:transglutaminase-like putative cysteine protease